MPSNKSTGHSTSRVYLVEARLTHNSSPTEENGMLLDAEWRHVRFSRSVVGVPSGLQWQREAEGQGYLSHDSATALAWWFLASCSALGVETRLVEYEFIYDFSVERKVDGEPIQRHVWSLQK